MRNRHKKQHRRIPFSKKLRSDIFERDNYKCQYCGAEKRHGVTLHVDHIMPVCRGGDNSDLNLVTACSECNFVKGSSWPPKDLIYTVFNRRALDFSDYCADKDISEFYMTNSDGDIYESTTAYLIKRYFEFPLSIMGEIIDFDPIDVSELESYVDEYETNHSRWHEYVSMASRILWFVNNGDIVFFRKFIEARQGK